MLRVGVEKVFVLFGTFVLEVNGDDVDLLLVIWAVVIVKLGRVFPDVGI